MRFRLAVCGLAVVFLLAVAPGARADSWTLALQPLSGAISGAPGATIGWGFTITNLSATSWLEIFSASADPFLHATPDGNIFTFPILAPLDSITVAFLASAQGLYQLTWDASAPIGFVNSGTFLLSGTFYDGDPLLGGNLLSSLDHTAAYSATVTAPPPTVRLPEPAPFFLLAAGIAALFLFVATRKCHRRASAKVSLVSPG